MTSEEIDLSNLKNIVLDLGGVLYGIEPARTANALRLLAGPNARHLQHDDELFLELEMGLVEPNEFRTKLRLAIDSKATEEELDVAWNALLLGVIPGREEWVRKLAGKYRVILLSNTNVIHQQIWGLECASMFAPMEKTWFSFDLGLRKPHRDIYDYVLSKMGMLPEESLFLDDSAANIEGAKSAGMQVGWIEAQDNAHFEGYCLKILNKV